MRRLRNSSLSFARQLSRSLDPRYDYEPQACYTSFCKHWQQVFDITVKSRPQYLHDDVLGVVNHMEQLTTLIVLEAKARELTQSTEPAACLEYLLSENLLDKLYQWASCTGKYENAVRLEQLKLFGSLIGHYSSQVIAAEPFLRPLLKLLHQFRHCLPPENLEIQLVTVLNQLCVCLMQNMQFIDLFFLTNHTDNGSEAEFLIVRLLLMSVHREGSAGAAARDALLLCAHMSGRCKPLAHYMLQGNTCPVLATGLSGLYSLLPLRINEHLHRLTSDDVNQVHKLTLFINSLEFCNAVAQVADPAIKNHLLDLLYQGFLVPVLGPALLQTREAPLQSGGVEQATSMLYLELILRCATPRGLLRAVLHYLLTYTYDGIKLIDALLARLDGNSQLSLVSLSLMETLIDLNCEDVMLELVYKYLIHGHHLMVTHRHKISYPEPYRDAAVAFLGLQPRCCARPLEKTKQWVDEMALSGRRVLDYRREDDRRTNGAHEDIAMNDLVHDNRFNYGNPNETLFGNYHAYLCDARFEIVSRVIACDSWSSKYDSVSSPKRETNNNTKETKEMDIQTPAKEQDSLISICTSGYDTLKTSDTSEKEQHSLNSLTENIEGEKSDENSEGKESSENQTSDVKEDCLSIGESSGYDSFRYKVDEDSECFAEESFKRSFGKVDAVREYQGEVPLVRSWRASAESIIGPLLSNLLKKAASLLESEVIVNCRVTSVVSKLASLPTPLLTSLLLCPGFVLQPNVPSLFQILSKLKDEVDELTEGLDNVSELVDKARVFLIQRELALMKTRRPANDDAGLGARPPPRESKRRTLSNSISHMFARRLSSSSPSQQQTQSLQNSAYNASPQKRPVFTQESYWNQSITMRSILNAVILDEWLKELASICEEHALRLSADDYEDDSYIRMVAL